LSGANDGKNVNLRNLKAYLDVRNVDTEPSIIGKKLIKWWPNNRRSYPWREQSDPYKILIAEIMLQRTKADQVLLVYQAFLQKFPTIFDLARGSKKEITVFFKKLGLLWRASVIKEMACYVVEKYNGIFPKEKKNLLDIPAVGDYMASAMLSFAYGEPDVVVDSNVCRIVLRVYGLDVKGEARKNKIVREIANKMLPSNIESRSFNFALIDFAALVCKPAEPLCQKCPINELCIYYLRT